MMYITLLLKPATEHAHHVLLKGYAGCESIPQRDSANKDFFYCKLIFSLYVMFLSVIFCGCIHLFQLS